MSDEKFAKVLQPEEMKRLMAANSFVGPPIDADKTMEKFR